MKNVYLASPSDSRFRNYLVMLLPHGEVAARRLSLREAIAFAECYNEVMRGALPHAVVREEDLASQVA